jgi:hypothetical protein
MRVRCLTALLVVLLVVGSALELHRAAPAGAQASKASAVLDDLLRLFKMGTLDDVARGGLPDLAETFRANSPEIANALRVSSFSRAVAAAAASASPRFRRFVAERFANLDASIQRMIERKLQTMLCEARLYAQNFSGDVEVLQPWVAGQFGSIGVPLTPTGTGGVAAWLTEKVNDERTRYSMACFAWVRLSG